LEDLSYVLEGVFIEGKKLPAGVVLFEMEVVFRIL